MAGQSMWLMILLVSMTAAAEDGSALPRTHDGRPDLNGIWQALGPAHWNIEAHSAYRGPAATSGALDAAPAGLGVVIGGGIPYRPVARQQQQLNFSNRGTADPLNRCYLPGVPRANYLPYPLQIVQGDEHVFIAYEFAQASRTIYMDRPDFVAPIDSWMGHSTGRWEEDTLVVEVTAQVADSWLDQAGNFHGPGLKVVERWTLEGPHHLRYEATLEDPETYTRPWQISLPLYRRIDDRAQLLEFKCVEFVEEMMYGHLRSEPESEPEQEEGAQP